MSGREGSAGSRQGGGIPGQPEVRVRVPAGPWARFGWLVALFAVAGCGGGGEAGGPGADAHEVAFAPALPPGPDAAGTRWVEETLAALSLEEAVGQLVFPWIAGGYWAEDDPEFLEAVEWIERWGIGGVAISIGTPHAYVAKLNALQARSELPLLVTSDFENGGPGMRIQHSYALPSLLPQGGGTSFPPTMAFGAIGDEEAVEALARITAREARAVGVHVNFAPVLDVNSNPENPIINTRAFGEDPEEVARLGLAYLRGAREGGVLTTAKHFPGHGDTRVDSHLVLPEVTADRERLDRVELVPFRAAVEAGVDAVMTAHVSVPGVLGPGAPPATLAPEFMTGILRDEMGFEGLLFTDALRMGAITEGYGAGEAAVLAFEAGADVILIPESVGAAVQAMVDAVETGRIARDRVDMSVRRILEAKARVGLHRERLVPIEGVTRRVGMRAHREAADLTAMRAMTLVRDRDGLVPLGGTGREGRVLSVTYAVPEDLTAGREFDVVLGALLPGVESARIGPATPEPELAALLARVEEAELVLVNAYLPPRAGAGSVALPEAVRGFVHSAAGMRPLVLTSLGNPYLLNALPEVGSYLVAWGDREVSQRAAARALAGAAPIGGRLPITLPGLHARGEGLDREAIPEMIERGEVRRDALDEAGLVRRSEEDEEAPPAGGGGAQVPVEVPAESPAERDPGANDPAFPAPADTVPPGGAVDGGEPTGLGGGVGAGPFVPPGPLGTPAPPSWRAEVISPLEVDPRSVGMDPAALEALDSYIERALAEGVAPGAALAVGRRGQLVRLRGYGTLDHSPGSASATPFTLFDLASLTKAIGTTTAVLVLAEEGRLELDDPVVRHLPEFSRADPRKDAVTLRDLLLHRGGLPAYRPFFREEGGPEQVREAVWDLPLQAAPGGQAVYSDIGFMVLGWVVESVSGEGLDTFLARRVFGPLGMEDTWFLPPAAERHRIAPSERGTERRPYPIHGEVHDENAHAMGGVAGHAGLFSTAQDLAVFAQLLLDGGRVRPCEHRPAGGFPCGARSTPIDLRFLPEGTVALLREQADPASSRTIGWDTPSGRSSAGDYFSARSFGHTGFTGTSIWIDPELELFVVLLTHRVNPSAENERHVPFRRAVHDAVAQAISDRAVLPRER